MCWEANMIIRTVGKSCHVSTSIVKKAASFYGKYLFSNSRISNNIELTIIFEKFSDGTDDYAYCDWIDDNHCSREFEITIDKILTKKETLLALAHEMVHLKQYAKGELKDIFRPARMIKWQNQKYEINEVEYWSSPWEREARAMEMELYIHFLRNVTV